MRHAALWKTRGVDRVSHPIAEALFGEGVAEFGQNHRPDIETKRVQARFQVWVPMDHQIGSGLDLLHPHFAVADVQSWPTERSRSMSLPAARVATVGSTGTTTASAPSTVRREPSASFAGIWAPQWTSVRKVRTGEETIDLFAFLTTGPNAEVTPIHPKAMPVILTTPEECETWMTAPWEQERTLQRPLHDGALAVVARGLKSDEVETLISRESADSSSSAMIIIEGEDTSEEV
ncbi:hypothetical protein B5U98_21005 [Bosea sp. Tri-39]|uniref:SOS response-associated peptidase family protein n=2 Tax=Bosea TaxID=85413 RepID=UPI000F7EB953|nr:hypothetical protein B5U98_21005 [Bosea sp. Tri-39]RXT37358.1 hypothetical protein B5U99_15320 [Bosea sp. Tri-54]